MTKKKMTVGRVLELVLILCLILSLAVIIINCSVFIVSILLGVPVGGSVLVDALASAITAGFCWASLKIDENERKQEK